MNYQRTQIEYKGILFDSIQECEFYKTLEDRDDITDLKVHPTYVLQPPFIYNGKKVNGIEYTPDFEYKKNGVTICIEVKGIPTPDFELRLKMWKYKNQDKIIKVMCFSKKTGWMEMGEYKKARKKIQREEYEERIKRQLLESQEKEKRKRDKLELRYNTLILKKKLNKKESERLVELKSLLGYNEEDDRIL